jgi:alpha-D-ribose 1-methylphosphonate 5-triphosphate synthase subunit PhnG
LYDKVYFLGEMSDSLETIDLGDITTTEPWVKIVDKSGKKGWVYGAGVDYYKHELKGVHTD